MLSPIVGIGPVNEEKRQWKSFRIHRVWLWIQVHLLWNNDQQRGQVFRIQNEVLLLHQIGQITSQQTAPKMPNKKKTNIIIY